MPAKNFIGALVGGTLFFSAAVAAAPESAEGVTPAAPYALAAAIDPVAQAIEGGARNVQSFIAGPSSERPEVGDHLNCEQIYDRIVRLAPRTYNYRAGYWEDPRNAAIGALGFVVTPMFYAWGYTAFDHYGEQQQIAAANREIDALRYASARQDCWVK